MTSGVSPTSRPVRRTRTYPGAVWALAVIAIVEALTGAGVVIARSSSPAQSQAQAISPVERKVTPPAGEPVPSQIEIPSIGVRAALVGLSVQPDGALGTPKEFQVAGWWSEGTWPGGNGPAVIVGHRDSYTGPAVFYGLGRLERGDPVSVRRSDDSVVTFVVDEQARFSKDGFPTERVYGATDRPTLRLITCGGRFDRATHLYEDNVVVFATLSEPASPAATPSVGAAP